MTGDRTVFKYMKDCCIELGNLFSMSIVEKTGSSRLKLQGGIRGLDVRERKLSSPLKHTAWGGNILESPSSGI